MIKRKKVVRIPVTHHLKQVNIFSQEIGPLQLPSVSKSIKVIASNYSGLKSIYSPQCFLNMEQDNAPIFPVPNHVSQGSITPSLAVYQREYEKSISDPDAFWAAKAEALHWFKKWEKVSEVDYSKANIKWFVGGKTNVSYNCLDRHLEERGDKTAIIYEGDEPGSGYRLSYRQLYEKVCQFANGLKSLGVKSGDRVAVYMPMVPEAAIAMLAIVRLGAVHSIIFGGFSADSISDRIGDCNAKVLITANEGLRGSKVVPLKSIVDEAMKNSPSIEKVIVVKRTEADTLMHNGRDLWYHELMAQQSTECPAEPMDSEAPLFILYTSGSTGKPKGVLHTTGGYLTFANITSRTVFDLRDDDIYCCAADIGWVTGHTYVVYGPLSNGATTVMFESIPTYPDAGRYWDMVERHKINIFYTAPTAIRAIAREGNGPVEKYDLSSLRILGTVGEPINPEAWRWYYEVVGGSRCQIVDTWWQTETGGILITPIAGATPVKAGSATLPFYGIQPCLVDEQGNEIEGNSVSGNLCIKSSWPGQMRTVYGDHQRFIDTYFSQYPGKYFTGDGAVRDKDGYYWITGRVDDVLNVSGHRLGSAEIESALVSHPSVAEAAVVGFPHDIKGIGVYAYVILNAGIEASDTLLKELVQQVRKEIGPIATPDKIHITPGLPKTRSGKIMRRILRKIATGDTSNLGDTSTLADPGVVDSLVGSRPD